MAVFGVFLPGCKDKAKAFCEDTCASLGQDAYYCGNQSTNNLICAPSASAAAGVCGSLGVVGGYDCDEAPAGTGGAQFPGWDPDAYVRYDRKEKRTYIDQQLIDEVAQDGSVLWVMDDARMEAQQSGYFRLTSITRDDLAYHLGFQTNDLVVSANGYDLKTYGDYGLAFAALVTATDIAVIVVRQSTPVTLSFRIE